MRPYFGFFLLAVWLGALAAPRPAHAQPVFERFTRASGLPSDYVLTIYQDRAGFLWFGTDSGVARYDGRAFRTFTAEDGLPDNLVYRFAEAEDGALYVATFGGLARFTGEAFESTHALRAPGITTDVLPLGPHLLTPSPSGTYAVAGDSIRRLHSVAGWLAPIDSARALTYSRDGAFVIHAADPEAFPTLAPVLGLPLGEVRFASLDPVTGEGIVSMLSADSRGETFRITLRGETMLAERSAFDLPVPESYVEAAQQTEDGLIVGLSSGGVWLREEGNDHSDTARWTQLLDTPLVEYILTDYEGTVWIGTFGQGVYRMRARHLTQHAKGRVVRLLADAQAGSEAARVLFTTEFGVWTYEADPAGGDGVHAAGRVAEPLLLREARALATNARSVAVTSGAALRVFSRADFERERTGRSTTADLQATETNWWSGVAWVGDTLWASTYGTGVRRFFPGGREDTLGADRGVPSPVVEDIVPTASGLWMLTRSGGAACYRRGALRTFRREDGLPSNAVYSAYEDARGETWLGTDRGAVRLEAGALDQPQPRPDVFAHPALAGLRVIAFFERPEDPHGVWAVAGQTLVRFDAARAAHSAEQPSAATRVYGGFALVPAPATSINAAAYLPARDRLLLGTTGGLVAVDLSLLPRASPPPRVAFTSVLADGVSAPYLATGSGGAGAFETGRLGPRVRELAVHFAPLTFRNAAASGVEYRLDGGRWSDASQSRSVTLAAPAPGTHTIEVRAVGPDGARSARPLRLTFTIVPTWWQTPWVLALLGVVLAGMIVAATRHVAARRYRERLRSLEARHRLERERQRISRDLHDHVGAQLTGLIAGLDLAVRRPEPDLMAALRGEARDALGQLRGTVWALRHSALEASEFAEQVRRYVAEQQRFVDVPTLHFHASLAAPHALTATEALNLLRIVQEALQNALKHAHATRIDVQLTSAPGTLVLEVRDDGTFRAPSDASGAGLQHMRARAEELGAAFEMETEGGTRVSVRLRR